MSSTRMSQVMSPEFALLLNMPTTRLLVREDKAWKTVGDASLDSDDPGAALEALRETGETVAGGSFSCLLILPNDQVKYLSAPAGPDDAATARAVLEGATPYAVKDLVFDWALAGERLYVAAVARETLAEAREFVSQHGFTPAGTVAYPLSADFPARPVFDSINLTRGEAPLPISGAHVHKAPSPPPAFATNRDAQSSATSDSDKGKTDRAPRLTLSSAPPASAKPAPAPSAPVKTAAISTAAATQTLAEPRFGTPATTAQIGGKPRYLGLLLTLALLAVLAAIALWSMTLGVDEVRLENPTESGVVNYVPAPNPEIPLEQADAAADEQEQPEDAIAVLPDIDAPTEELLPDLPAPAQLPALISDAEIAALYEASGIWQRAPRTTTDPSAQSLDQLYVASIDPRVQPSDAIALPDIASLLADEQVSTPTDPVASDQTFALDDVGRVIPTAEGALSPDGILVFAGRPPVTIAPRAAAAEAEPPAPDQRLAALRPEARPNGLQEAKERAQLGGRTLEEFANIRPKPRPKAPQELAAEIAAAAASASAALENPPQTAQPEAAPDPFATATRLAAATSRKPQTRPRSFASRVETSRTRAAEPSGGGNVVASVAPRSVRPSGPVPTSVSRAATMDNAINLRRINLIGVFGKPSSRSALVRLKNGRFKKVKVGDRIDGGRVAAIGESELRYVKSGRNLILTIPSG